MDDRFSALDGDLMTDALMMEEFNRLVQESGELESVELPTPTPIAPQVVTKSSSVAEPTKKPHDLREDGTLEALIQHAHQQNKERLQAYQAFGKELEAENVLVFFDGFDEEEGMIPSKTTGGFFFSHEGFGVAVNPGRNFLERFHDTGHHISEIDAVIITRDDQEDYQDLHAIYHLNRQCNLNTSEFHLIRYFLHPSVYRTASSQLKPHFKQERNSLVSLDLFEERETLELSAKLKVTYMESKEGNLSLVFDLQTKKIGYFARAPYTVDSLNLLNGCDILILGFDETSPKDLMMHEMMEKSLGFSGAFNLCNELGPKVAFIAEHNGLSGDIRIELLKRLKSALAKENCSTVLFPVECGLYLDLSTMKLNGEIEVKQARVIQPEGPFAPLHFISNESIL